jgi:RNA binding exosome subunit
MTGHHGNPIIRVDTKLARHDAVEFAKSLNQRLSGIDRLRLQRDLSLYSDEDGNLYIRLDKQHLFNDEIKLGDDDPIRVRMKFNRLIGDPGKLMMRYLEP